MKRNAVWGCRALLIAVVSWGAVAQTPWAPVRVKPVRECSLPVTTVSGLTFEGGLLYAIGQNPDGTGWIGAYTSDLQPVAQASWSGNPAGLAVDSTGRIWVLDLRDRSLVAFVLDPAGLQLKPVSTVLLPRFPPTLCEGTRRFERGVMAIDSQDSIWVMWSVGTREPACGRIMLWSYDVNTGQAAIVEYWTPPPFSARHFHGAGLAVDRSGQIDMLYFGTFLRKGTEDSGLHVWRMDTMFLSTLREFGFGSYGTQLEGPFFAAHGGKLCVVAWGGIPGGRGTDILVQVFDGAGAREEGGSSFGWQSMTNEIAYGVAADVQSPIPEFYVVGTDMTDVLLLKVDETGRLLWSKAIAGKGTGKALAISGRSIYIAAEPRGAPAVIMKIEN